MSEKKTVQDKMMERFKVKVIKSVDDGRNAICGEPIEPDGEGNQVAIIPGHQADYINKSFPAYKVSDPYIPGVDLESTLAIQPKPEADEIEDFTCPECGKVCANAAGLAAHQRSHN